MTDINDNLKNVKIGDTVVLVDNSFCPLLSNNKALVVDVYPEAIDKHIFILFENDSLLFTNSREIKYSYSFTIDGRHLARESHKSIIDVIPA